MKPESEKIRPDICQFSAKKLALIFKANAKIPFSNKLGDSILSQNANFVTKILGENNFKNHNICT
jgi:ribosomal protein L15